MSSNVDPDAFEREAGGFAPGCSFLKKGTVHEGYIVARRVVADIDPKTKKPKFFENSGEPKRVMVFTLETEERDDEIEDDDGTRSLWARWKIMDAIKDALAVAGVKNTAVGGWLSVKFVRQDKPTSAAMSGVKHFEAVYEPPEEPDDEADEYEDEPDEEEAPPPRSRRKPAKKATPSRRRQAEPEEDEDEDEAPPPRSRSRRRRAEPEPEEEYEDEDETEDEPPARSRRRAPAKKAPAKRAGRRRLTEDAAF